ncbi:MAG: transposase [Lentisphaerae bacterium]|jgi:hypothetical protein|nr:transposase [Lentisphaerota bacterium]
MTGIWLLVPELLRLGAWDMLRGWGGCMGVDDLPARLALHLVNEAALGTLLRRRITISQKGFEVVNGLPFVPSDMAVHDLLAGHTMLDAQNLEMTLGRIRRASGHYCGRLLAIDPHHMTSYTKRQTVRRRLDLESKAKKTLQTVFVLDVDTEVPICNALCSSSCTVSQTVPVLLRMTAAILPSGGPRPLVLADGEHFCEELFKEAGRLGFDLLVPLPNTATHQKLMQRLPETAFSRHWPGYATARTSFRFQRSDRDYTLLVQREGESPGQYTYEGFVCTSPRDELETLTQHYPKRWHIEEFFNRDQSIGWQRAGTHNLNIRGNHMALALLAQAAVHQFRSKLPEQCRQHSCNTLAQHYFNGLDGDVRVEGDTIIVTYYNAPSDKEWRCQYENLPRQLEAEGVSAVVPWLYGFKLDFRFN